MYGVFPPIILAKRSAFQEQAISQTIFECALEFGDHVLQLFRGASSLLVSAERADISMQCKWLFCAAFLAIVG